MFILPFPKTPSAEADIPVAQLLIQEELHGSASLGRPVIFKKGSYILDQSMQAGEYPAVYFRTLFYGNVLFLKCEIINIGIQCKELVGVEKSSKILPLNLFNSF